MSNPAVIILAEGQLSDKTHIRIEDNLGESIHVHLNKETFYLTIEEFEDLVGAVQNSVKALLADRNIDLDGFDVSAFDWDWIKKYRQISSIQKKQVKLSDLYTVNNVERFGKMDWRFVSLEQSHNYQALQGNTGVLSRYHLHNLYGKDNLDRLRDILQSVRENGYPFEGKYIIVNQYGVIYDGAHRAAALLYLRGDQTVPVVEITFDNDPVPAEQNERQDQMLKAKIKAEKRSKILRFLPRLIKGAARKLYHLIKREKKVPAQTSASAQSTTRIGYEELVRFISENQISALLIPKPKYNASLAKIADETLITDERGYAKLIDYIKTRGIVQPAYENYRCIYSIAPPMLLSLKEKTILIARRIFCKSLDEDTLLPVDAAVVKRSWETANVNADGLPEADASIVLICTILDAMLEQRAFLPADRELIQQNKELLNSAAFYELLEKEFFNFAAPLRELLDREAFDEALQRYLTFCNY